MSVIMCGGKPKAQDLAEIERFRDFLRYKRQALASGNTKIDAQIYAGMMAYGDPFCDSEHKEGPMSDNPTPAAIAEMPTLDFGRADQLEAGKLYNRVTREAWEKSAFGVEERALRSMCGELACRERQLLETLARAERAEALVEGMAEALRAYYANRELTEYTQRTAGDHELRGIRKSARSALARYESSRKEVAG